MTGRKPFFRPRLAFSGGRSVANTPISGDGASTLTREQTQQFHDLILPHLDGAYNLARFLARDAMAAEDIVQEAFLRAFRAFPTYRGGSPKAWLFTIVRNCFLNGLSARGAASDVLVDEGALSEPAALALANVADVDQDSPEQSLLRRREAERVRAVIGHLPEPFRETLVLREMDELSYKEIALLTGTPMGTVMSRLARARQMLCELLAPAAGAPDSSPFREAQP